MLQPNHIYRFTDGRLYRCLKITASKNAIVRRVKDGCKRKFAAGSVPLIVSINSEVREC